MSIVGATMEYQTLKEDVMQSASISLQKVNPTFGMLLSLAQVFPLKTIILTYSPATKIWLKVHGSRKQECIVSFLFGAL